MDFSNSLLKICGRTFRNPIEIAHFDGDLSQISVPSFAVFQRVRILFLRLADSGNNE